MDKRHQRFWQNAFMKDDARPLTDEEWELVSLFDASSWEGARVAQRYDDSSAWARISEVQGRRRLRSADWQRPKSIRPHHNTNEEYTAYEGNLEVAEIRIVIRASLGTGNRSMRSRNS